MKNFTVKVTPTTAPILKDFAYQRGWKSKFDYSKLFFKEVFLIFFIEEMEFGYTNFKSHAVTNYKLLSLEEAFERITEKKEFKDGDWLFHSDKYDRKWVFRYKSHKERTYYHYEAVCYSSFPHTFSDGTISGVDIVRKATFDEAKEALIHIAKERGFPTKKWEFGEKTLKNIGLDEMWEYDKEEDTLKNFGGDVYRRGEWATPIKSVEMFGHSVTKDDLGNYEFGCKSHTYTKDELKRFRRTIWNLPRKVTVSEILKNLSKIEKL